MTQRTYNFIYEKLVKDKDDVLGIIAYSLYKRNQIDFIIETSNALFKYSFDNYLNTKNIFSV